jgi:hypothetical protein
MGQEEYDKHLTMIKLVITSQVIVELIDELKGTAQYRQDVKFHAKNLSDKLESILTTSYKFIDGKKQEEETYRFVERGFRKLLEVTVDELYELGEIPA